MPDVEKNLEARLSALYERLDELGDLRMRGYSVPASEITSVKRRINELESLKV